MIYLVSFTSQNMVYARRCGSQYDAANTMKEANRFHSHEFYIEECKKNAKILAEMGGGVHSARIASDIVLTIISP